MFKFMIVIVTTLLFRPKLKFWLKFRDMPYALSAFLSVAKLMEDQNMMSVSHIRLKSAPYGFCCLAPAMRQDFKWSKSCSL